MEKKKYKRYDRTHLLQIRMTEKDLKQAKKFRKENGIPWAYYILKIIYGKARFIE